MAEAAFQQVQRQFAAHLRDPQRNAPPSGIEDRRLQIYRELFYNNIEDCLASAFPVLRQLSPDAVWHARVRDFYARHQSHAPQFHQIAEEFLRYLEDERGEHPDDPPFLRELAHYEWVELALAVAEAEIDDADVDTALDLLAGRPLQSPLAWSLAYEYPVHRIGPEFQPQAPSEQPSYLVVYRDRQDSVRFMEINAVTARLLQLLEEDPDASGRELLLRIAAELGHPQPQQVVEQGAAILRDLRARDILLGTRR
ncbi:MAG TPA: putative DNA-binding domain-containing protein [Solimonas sp.]|nr:putative DNA-binding domain-containing protein [Solimonas sp.]